MPEMSLDRKIDQAINLLIRQFHQGSKIDAVQHLVANLLIERIKEKGILPSLHHAEFKVYSQFGDDGIIQYLIHHIGIPQAVKTFVEFGVEHYAEANTRFLIEANNWSGLVMDSSAENIESIKRDYIYWRNHLDAICAFINRDNINELIQSRYRGEIGILSIDIDGNDYWIWEAIQGIDPILVIAEYNSTFGKEHAITIPYDPKFQRRTAHFSNVYFGCSLKALCMLAEKKGYAFVGSNQQGNNAYFVRKDKVGKIPIFSAETGYVESTFRESMDPAGALTYLSMAERRKLIGDMPVFDLERQKQVFLKELFGSAIASAGSPVKPRTGSGPIEANPATSAFSPFQEPLSQNIPVDQRMRMAEILVKVGGFLNINQVLCRTLHGQFLVDLRDTDIGRTLMTRGEHSYRENLRWLSLFPESRKGARTLVDIGANIGTTSIPFALENRFDRFVAFEPDPTNFSLLKLNVEANELAQMFSLHNLAIGSMAGTVELELSPDNLGDHRVRHANLSGGLYNESDRKVIPVPCDTLDHLFEKAVLSLEAVALIKSDTQGHEGHVFKGATRILSQRKIPWIIEFWPYGIERSGISKEELTGILTGSFADMIELEPNGSPVRHPIHHIHDLFLKYSGVHWCNIILLP